MRPFRKAGALVESVCVDDHGAFRGIRHQKTLRSIASARGDIRLDALPKGIFDGPKDCFGIVLTPHRMLKPHGEKMAALSGSAEYLGFAAVSLYRLPQNESHKIVTAMVKRQAARLFILGGCTENCLVRAASDLQDYVERFAMPPDLCGFCTDKIEMRILFLKS